MGTCSNSIVVNATRQKVWDTIINFHDLSWAPNVIESLDIVGDKGGLEIGAKRLLNGVFSETLTSVDEGAFTFEYSINDGPGPLQADAVQSYIGKVQLNDVDGKTEVVWSSEFSANDDNAVAEFCNPVYQALLGDLAQTLG